MHKSNMVKEMINYEPMLEQEYINYQQSHNPRILVGKKCDYYKPIEFNQICFIRSTLGKVKIKTNNDAYYYKRNLTYLESFLPQDTFFRCHRAFIVNLYQIDRIISKSSESLVLIMNDQEKTEIRVSQNITSKFRSLLNF